MKLWRCYAHGIDWEHYEYVVEETAEDAEKRFTAETEDNLGWCAGVYIDQVTEIDGYKVKTVTDAQIVLSK